MSRSPVRCAWVGEDPLYQRYHDSEWGVPKLGDRELFEKLTLEGFQSGLSWLTILRKRENFRAAFAGFDVERIGVVGPDWKYLRTGEEEELYALTPEPDERSNRIDADPEVAAEMRGRLDRQLAEHPLNLIDAPEISEETLELLKALGYL